jgi:hypothetical protein
MKTNPLAGLVMCPVCRLVYDTEKVASEWYTKRHRAFWVCSHKRRET